MSAGGGGRGDGEGGCSGPGDAEPRPRPAEVHVLLLDDLLLLLQRQDERLLLKSHSRTLTPTPDGKTMLRPVLRLTSAMTREVATGEAPPLEWEGTLGKSWERGHRRAREGGRCERGPGAWPGARRVVGLRKGAGQLPRGLHGGAASSDQDLKTPPGYLLGTIGEQMWRLEPSEEGFANVLPGSCTSGSRGFVERARLGICCLMAEGV